MKKCINLSIGKTTITKKPDYDADTSYLGEYGDKLKPGCIIRADRTFYEDIVKNSCTHMANNEECIGYVDPLSYDGKILKELKV